MEQWRYVWAPPSFRYTPINSGSATLFVCVGWKRKLCCCCCVVKTACYLSFQHAKKNKIKNLPVSWELSYPPLSVLQSTNTLQPAHCTCPRLLAPPAGWSVCDSRLHCRSQSARRAGWRWRLCTSGCYIWGWTRCSRGSHGSSRGRSYPAEV